MIFCWPLLGDFTSSDPNPRWRRYYLMFLESFQLHTGSCSFLCWFSFRMFSQNLSQLCWFWLNLMMELRLFKWLLKRRFQGMGFWWMLMRGTWTRSKILLSVYLSWCIFLFHLTNLLLSVKKQDVPTAILSHNFPALSKVYHNLLLC